MKFNPNILAILILNLFSLTIYGQEIKPEFDSRSREAAYILSVPKDWGVERFPIPISFAPQIPYKGIEDIRFTPGWAKAAGDDYWSYAFLWYLEGKVETNVKTLNSNMETYYKGLIAGNGPNISKEKLIPVVASFKEAEKNKDDLQTYTGTIHMLDYMQQKPIVLNCKVHVKSCGGEDKTSIFYELSPKSFSHTIWQSLDQLWLDFKCKKD